VRARAQSGAEWFNLGVHLR